MSRPRKDSHRGSQSHLVIQDSTSTVMLRKSCVSGYISCTVCCTVLSSKAYSTRSYTAFVAAS